MIKVPWAQDVYSLTGRSRSFRATRGFLVDIVVELHHTNTGIRGY